jgi:hypothetical protein
MAATPDLTAPLVFDTFRTHGGPHNGERGHFIRRRQGRMIARLTAGDERQDTNETREEDAAYARLFVAAPDLLKAVEHLLNRARIIDRNDPDPCEMARAAIAKARGGGA